jgi:hypothetical protein
MCVVWCEWEPSDVKTEGREGGRERNRWMNARMRAELGVTYILGYPG